jgi:hypothetical protein
MKSRATLAVVLASEQGIAKKPEKLLKQLELNYPRDAQRDTSK